MSKIFEDEVKEDLDALTLESKQLVDKIYRNIIQAHKTEVLRLVGENEKEWIIKGWYGRNQLRDEIRKRMGIKK